MAWRYADETSQQAHNKKDNVETYKIEKHKPLSGSTLYPSFISSQLNARIAK
ncbi:hypothetical protein [Marinagarivorans algicola]|uniref:hypothetical protein n=1 Tax=Marinagarivorans algicola TaxID=1513270 RepID=UPI0012E1DFA8|nr:hypothetical protein [Marinagarivorans algicola]